MATAYRPILTSDQRRDRRVLARVTGAAVMGANGSVSAELDEISIYGCRLLLPGDVTMDGAVELSLDGAAPLPAEIVWNRGGVVACRFAKPISRAQLRTLTIRPV